MPRPIFVNNNFYHVYNRGVEKRKVFLDQKDYLRFVHDLFEFNDQNAVTNVDHRVQKYGDRISINRKPRKLLVDIVCWCLMPNHFHLLLRQLVDGGISRFMQKLGIGFTMYFNQRYERSGVLFQGKFKTVPIKDDIQLTHTSRYAHLNPVELLEPQWKEEGIKNWPKAEEFLRSYRWSSYPDYVDKNNFPSIIRKNFLMAYFDNDVKRYKEFVRSWALKDIGVMGDLMLE